ncbi:hypothetical protein [Chamaesiphon minutus]|uniref:Uncharacterized protein n=1 Tax=Chamaesiphon minutus (strain ATCC 27169 / PCC 6605) TaxID=1173020 RepID=K9UII5_CHAP6|nr:hypothetical protein [Chamaesiphon minutus]AFY94917.1 hypothetical protein Cha6605_3953 [Chamaesiphon minutus PCC 6605]
MLTKQDLSSIKKFYGRQMEESSGGRIRRFLSSISIGYVTLADEYSNLEFETQFPSTNISDDIDRYHREGFPKVKWLPDAIKIKRLDSSKVPVSVIESFNRHIWYSRYCLTEIHVVKFHVANLETFAVYIEGYVDDGWDNGITGWEIYEASGNFIFSLIRSNGKWFREDNFITSEDFGTAKYCPSYTPELAAQSPSPIWIEEGYNGFWSFPLWSEDEVKLVRR